MRKFVYHMDGDPDEIEMGVAATIGYHTVSKNVKDASTYKGYKRKSIQLTDLDGLYSISCVTGYLSEKGLVNCLAKIAEQDGSVEGAQSIQVFKIVIDQSEQATGDITKDLSLVAC